MLNGRNHSAARKGLAVNGRGSNAVAEADASALYGEYEQKLASDLAELLKSGGVASAAGALRTSSPSGPPPLGSSRTASPVHVHPSRYRRRFRVSPPRVVSRAASNRRSSRLRPP